MEKKRLEHLLPECIAEWGWKFHHLGIPTDKVMPGERYLPQYKFYVSGFSTSPFGVEWMRFEEDCPLPEITKTVPHLAFQVDDIDDEIDRHNFDVVSAPGSPADGIRSAMIFHDGAPIELIEFKRVG